MKGQMVVETTVKVAAEEFWDAYRDIKRVRILHELLGEMVGEPRVEHGDGGVGTIVSIANPPGLFLFLISFYLSDIKFSIHLHTLTTAYHRSLKKKKRN